MEFQTAVSYFKELISEDDDRDDLQLFRAADRFSLLILPSVLFALVTKVKICNEALALVPRFRLQGAAAECSIAIPTHPFILYIPVAAFAWLVVSFIDRILPVKTPIIRMIGLAVIGAVTISLVVLSFLGMLGIPLS